MSNPSSNQRIWLSDYLALMQVTKALHPGPYAGDDLIIKRIEDVAAYLSTPVETPAVHPVTAECVEHDCQCQRGALKTISPRSEGEAP